MKQYEKYKESNHQGIGVIPAEWKEAKVKHLFAIGRGRVISQQELIDSGRYPVYSSQTKNDGCMGYIDTFDFEEEGILTWTTDGANAGEVFKRSGKFNCTNVCGTLKPIKSINLDYYLYFLKNITPFYKRPDTNGAKIMNNEMAEICAVIPSLTEQGAIAKYLDYVVIRVDEVIGQKWELIERLQAKRKALINEVVTRGLAPTVPTRPSGIDWLGNIPAHWGISKIKYLAELKSGSNLVSEQISSDGEYPVYGGNGLRGFYQSYSDEGYFVLIGRQGALCGNINYAKGKFWATEHAVVCYPNNVFETIWFGELLRAMNLNQYSIASAQPGLAVERIKNLAIPHPSHAEQKEIVTFIEERTTKIDNLVGELQGQIERLKQYKTAIISEAVTGKIDVREWQQPTNN